MRIIKETDSSVLLECAFCEGNGVQPLADWEDILYKTIPCNVCQGKGFFLEKTEYDNLIECSFCNGLGRHWNEAGGFDGDECPVCKGKGYNYIYDLEGQKNIFWEKLHPVVKELAYTRYESKNYADSVEAVLKELNKKIKEIVKEKISVEMDGASLMEKAFNSENPVIKLNNLETSSDKDIQKGYQKIFSGVMTGIRNPKAHDNIVIEELNAIHLLYLVSHLFYKLDKAIY